MAAVAGRRDRELADFMRAAAGADSLRPRGLSHLLLLAAAAFVVAFISWASWATLVEVTRGDGRVIPSRQVQVMQNLEGSFVAAINVRHGDVVDEGQVVIRIDNVLAASDVRERRARYLALEAAASRLRAEIDETAVAFPPEVLADATELAANEQDLFTSRQAKLQGELDLLQRRVEQREQELAELRTRLMQLERSFALAREELSLTEPLAQKRSSSRGRIGSAVPRSARRCAGP